MFPAAALALVLQAPVQKPVKDHWPHSYDLLDVNWHVKLNPAKSEIEGEVTNTVKALADNATLHFDSVKLTILSAEVDGKAAAISRGETSIVVVPRNRKLKTGETVKVKIRYKGSPEAGIYFIPAERAYPAKTPVVYTQGEMVDTRYWIPTYDYPDDKATSEGTIEVPSGWNTLSNGTLIKVTKNSSKGYDTFHWKMDKPHSTYLISLVAGPFTEVPDGTVPVKTSIFTPVGLEMWGKSAFGNTDKIIQFYGKLTHFPYPYSKFAQAAVPDFMYGGMENITAVTQTITAIFPPSEIGSNDSTGLVAHELAHQWFGDTVTCPSWSHAWVNEGWATFLPPFYERERHGNDAFAIERYGIFQGGLAAHEGATRPVVWDGYKEAVDMFDNFIYPGGASRMFMLMHHLGEDKFWDCVGKYLEDNKYKNVDTPQFFASFSKNSGEDLTPFMKQWFYTPAAPNLTVTREGSTVKITQPAPFFDLDLDVWVLDKEWVKKKVHLIGGEAKVDFEGMTSQPVLVDPECWVMANIRSDIPLTFEQQKALWVAAPNAGERARMMDSMFGSVTPEQWLELAKVTDFNQTLGQVVGRLNSSAVDYLWTLIDGKDRTLAKAALVSLCRLKVDDKSKARLQAIAKSEKDDSIREVAIRKLINQYDDIALAKKSLNEESSHDMVRLGALDWFTSKRPDEARLICLDILAKPPTETIRHHAISILGRLKDAPGEKKVYNALIKVLAEKSFGARSTAISALGDYGDKAALPILKTFVNHPQVFFRNSVRGVIERLESKK